jgi:hypothetical protein
VGGALVGVGVLVGALLLGLAVSHSIGEFRDLGDDVDAMDRISVPGEGVVTIDGAGDRVIYVEGGGGAAPIATLSPTEVTVESTAPDSTPIPVRNVSVSETYDLSGHSGRAALEFTVDEPGDYRIAVEEAPSSVTNVAVGPHLDLIGPIGSIFVAVFVPAGVGGVLVIAGAVVLIVTGVRRSAAQRREQGGDRHVELLECAFDQTVDFRILLRLQVTEDHARQAADFHGVTTPARRLDP